MGKSLVELGKEYERSAEEIKRKIEQIDRKLKEKPPLCRMDLLRLRASYEEMWCELTGTARELQHYYDEK